MTAFDDANITTYATSDLVTFVTSILGGIFAQIVAFAPILILISIAVMLLAGVFGLLAKVRKM